MARRKRNPTVGTVLAVGGAAALVVGGISWAIAAAVRETPAPKKRRCKKGFVPKVIEGGDGLGDVEICVPEGEPVPEPKTVRNRPGEYVGASGYTNWPYKELFPNEQAFVQRLASMGYDTGPSLKASKGKAAIDRFQADYNRLSNRLEAWLWEQFLDDPLDIGRITEDGRMGEQTIHALVAAIGITDTADMTWQQLLAFKRSDLRPVDDDGEIVIEDEGLTFPGPRRPIAASCQELIRQEVTDYAAGAGNAEGLIELVTTQCNTSGNPDIDRAIVLYLFDVAAANNLHDLRQQAESVLANT